MSETDEDERLWALGALHDLENIQCGQALERGDLGDAIKHRERMAEISDECYAIVRANTARLCGDELP